MRWWNRNPIYPIGIDVSHDAVHMVQLRQTPAGVAVLATARRPVDPAVAVAQRAEATTQIVRRLLKQEGFARHAGVIALPDEILHVRTVRVKVGSTDSFSNPASIPEVSRAFDFDLSQASPRVLEAGEVRQGNHCFHELIVVAAKNLEVEAWLAEWRKAAIRVESLEVRPCSLYRTMNRLTAEARSVQAMVEIGKSSSRVIIGSGATICFIKSVPVGSEQLNQSVARKLGVTPADAAQLRQRLAASSVSQLEERNDPVRLAVFDATRAPLEDLAAAVAGCLRYHAVAFRGAPPARLALFGADSTDPQLRSALAAAVTMPIDSPDPFAGIELSAMKATDRTAPRGAWAGAVGLALKQLGAEGRHSAPESVSLESNTATDEPSITIESDDPVAAHALAEPRR